MNPLEVLEAKREGRSLDRSSLSAFMNEYLAGEVEEHQMSAFLMAVQFQGLDSDELAVFVDVMLHSGSVLDLKDLPSAPVDKHSTGGVGDKVSIALAPLVAEAGLHVPMMSGRGLGHTGGTLDKLEAIPGFRTDLPLSRFMEVLRAERTAMIGQTDEIAPLDRRLYALRSVTGTVPSIPLIAASIMSKKLAEGLTALVLDVKVGSGAFLPAEDDALELARTMIEIGERHGVATTALLTAMDRPLGRSVGNALETLEAIECLRGEGPDDLRELVLALAAEMVVSGTPDVSGEDARARVEELLDGGAPLERLARMIKKQGGDPAVVSDAGRMPRAPVVRELRSRRAGKVLDVAPLPLGRGTVDLGGGRIRLDQAIDPSVGFDRLVQPGEDVEVGSLLGRVHAHSEADADAGTRRLEEAIRVSGPGEGESHEGRDQRPLVLARVSRLGVQRLDGSATRAAGPHTRPRPGGP